MLVCLDSRLRGNDMGVEFVQTYQGYIFVAIDRPLGYMVLPPFHKIGEIHKRLSRCVFVSIVELSFKFFA